MAKSFAEWFAAELRRNEWTATDFAKRANVSPSMVSRWLRGTVPSPESCDVIADVLRADVDLVLTLAGHRPRTGDEPDLAMAGLISRLRRIRLTPEREVVLRSTLDGYLTYDRQTSAATKSPARRQSQ